MIQLLLTTVFIILLSLLWTSSSSLMTLVLLVNAQQQNVVPAASPSMPTTLSPNTVQGVFSTSTNEVPLGRIASSLPPFNAQPFFIRPVFFSWSLRLETSGEWILRGTVTFDSSATTKFSSSSSSTTTSSATFSPFWFGVGLKSAEGMKGPLVICAIPSSSSMASSSSSTVQNDGNNDNNNNNNEYEDKLKQPQCKDCTLPQTANNNNNLYGQPIRSSRFVNASNNVNRTQFISGSVFGTGDGYFSFETVVQKADVADSTALIAREQSHRVIFARGPLDAKNAIILPHAIADDDTVEMLINFDSGQVERFKQIRHTLTFYVIGAAVPLSAFVGIYDVHRHFPRSSTNWRNILSIAGILTYLGILVTYMSLRYSDYVKQGSEKASFRCIGDGASLVLSCMVLPVTKKGLFHHGFGVSHERAIKYHALQAILLILFVFAHMICWIQEYSFEFITRWKENDHQSHLPGLLAFIVMLFVAGPAFLRSKIWSIFRMSHYFVVLIYFFAVLHFPPLLLGVLPGVLLHFAVTAFNRYRECHSFHQSIEAAFYDEEAGIVSIDILRSTPVDPGQYFYLNLPELNSGEFHPFSVAKMHPIGNHTDPALCRHRVAQLSSAGGIGSPSALNNKEFDEWLLRPRLSGQLTTDLVGGDSASGLIDADGNPVASPKKNTSSGGNGDGDNTGGGGVEADDDVKKEADEDFSSTATRPILSFMKPYNDWCYLRLMVKVSRDKNTWTNRLAQYLKKKQQQQQQIEEDQEQQQQQSIHKKAQQAMVLLPFANFRTNGPYGKLDVNPAIYCQFVFVAGGIGINPLLYMLQCMSLGMIELTGDPISYLSVSFYWVVREEAMYESYVQDLVYCKMRLEKLCPWASVKIKVFITASSEDHQNRIEDVLDKHSQKLLKSCIKTERRRVSSPFSSSKKTTTNNSRPDFAVLAEEVLENCKVAAQDPRPLTAPEDTTSERESLLRKSIAVYVSGPEEMQTSATNAFQKLGEKERKEYEVQKAIDEKRQAEDRRRMYQQYGSYTAGQRRKSQQEEATTDYNKGCFTFHIQPFAFQV